MGTITVRELKKWADFGDPYYGYELFLHYLWKYGPRSTKVKKNVNLLQYSADVGITDSQFFLALCYELGIGFDQDIQVAERYYTRAGWGWDGDAAFCLYKLLEPQDEAHAFFWLNCSQLSGNPLAEFRYGLLLENGKGSLSKSTAEAIKYYRQAAKQDYYPAICNLVNLKKRLEKRGYSHKDIESLQYAAKLKKRALSKKPICQSIASIAKGGMESIRRAVRMEKMDHVPVFSVLAEYYKDIEPKKSGYLLMQAKECGE